MNTTTKTKSLVSRSPITTKRGVKFPEGTEFKLSGWNGTVATLRGTSSDGTIQELKMRAKRFVLFKGIKSPSSAVLNRWGCDGICKSVLGNTVEPDGVDGFGAPSWYLALGLI
jgi:hypothetical protein